MQAAGVTDHIRSGPQIEMIGVGEHDADTASCEFVRCHALD